MLHLIFSRNDLHSGTSCDYFDIKKEIKVIFFLSFSSIRRFESSGFINPSEIVVPPGRDQTPQGLVVSCRPLRPGQHDQPTEAVWQPHKHSAGPVWGKVPSRADLRTKILPSWTRITNVFKYCIIAEWEMLMDETVSLSDIFHLFLFCGFVGYGWNRRRAHLDSQKPELWRCY